jgi:uncharacterized protein
MNDSNKWALVTGASKGIGEAFASELANKGYNLLLVARTANLLLEVAKKIKGSNNIKIETLALDLSEYDSSQKLYSFCELNKLNISVLINNAGYGLSGKIDKYSIADNSNMIQLNVLALTQITQTFIPLLEKNNPAFILNVASTASYQAIPGLAIYSATKAYVLSFSRALYHELKPRGIHVTAVSPGPTATEFSDRAQVGKKGLKAAEKVNMTAEEVAKIGLDALFSKKPEVVTGLLNKVGALGAGLLPKFISEKIAGSLYE